MLPAGIVADRLPRRLVMLSADVLRAATVAAVAVLSVTDALELWHLALASGLVGIGEALFIPSYTALVPQLLPDDQILAANGLEGTVRPLAQQAIGPALGGIAVALLEPGLAIGLAAAAFLFSAGCLAMMRADSRPERSSEERPTALSDLREGVGYVRRTPWLWASLTFAFIAVFFFVGPFEVLTPFVITDQVGGGSAEYGILLATFGIGSAIGALGISSRPLPRRYLTVMLGVWGLGLLPLALFGIATELWILLVAAIVVGVTEGVGTGDLGNASSTPGARRAPRTRVEPRLLPLAGAPASVDGARGPGGRGVRHHGGIRGGGGRLSGCRPRHVLAGPAQGR